MKLRRSVRREGEQRTRPRGERGSAAIEAVVLAPVMILFVLLVIAGGQIARPPVRPAIAADTAAASWNAPRPPRSEPRSRPRIRRSTNRWPAPAATSRWT